MVCVYVRLLPNWLYVLQRLAAPLLCAHQRLSAAFPRADAGVPTSYQFADSCTCARAIHSQGLSADFPRADAVVQLAALAHYNLQVSWWRCGVSLVEGWVCGGWCRRRRWLTTIIRCAGGVLSGG